MSNYLIFTFTVMIIKVPDTEEKEIKERLQDSPRGAGDSSAV